MPIQDAPERHHAIAGPRLAATTQDLPGWLALTRAQEHLADCEAKYFAGNCHQDELRDAYAAVVAAERAVVEARA